MKPFYVDMGEFSISERESMALNVLVQFAEAPGVRIGNAVSDLLYVGDDTICWCSQSERFAGIYTVDYDFFVKHGLNSGNGFDAFVKSIHSGPILKSQVVKGREECVSLAGETAVVPEEAVHVTTLLSAKRALELAKHKWMTGENEELNMVLARIAEAARNGDTYTSFDGFSRNTERALGELGYKITHDNSSLLIAVGWEEKSK